VRPCHTCDVCLAGDKELEWHDVTSEVAEALAAAARGAEQSQAWGHAKCRKPNAAAMQAAAQGGAASHVTADAHGSSSAVSKAAGASQRTHLFWRGWACTSCNTHDILPRMSLYASHLSLGLIRNLVALGFVHPLPLKYQPVVRIVLIWSTGTPPAALLHSVDALHDRRLHIKRRRKPSTFLISASDRAAWPAPLDSRLQFFVAKELA
jgi:hypothetical protein